MEPRVKRRSIYGLGLIPLTSLVIGVMPAYSGQQSDGQPSQSREQTAKQSQDER
ncbi:MAG TPA: hypothetical protein VJ746_19100 [Nitrospira sp.]|nr:hypothetical protein [Nitrospira sp.]